MAPQLGLAAVAFISPQNHPILIRVLTKNQDDALKYHYLAHTSLDVIDERTHRAPPAAGKSTECYLGFLYAMEETAVYGYVTPLKLKIVLAFALSDAVVRDADVTAIFKALHLAYYRSISNPFLKLHAPLDTTSTADHAIMLQAGSERWKAFRRRVDEVARAAGAVPVSNT
ncbi:Sedlin [Dentipellis sp. KUC8613]|nr:Sedlin [Dentipellis sp. KUC8613]